MCPIYSLHQWGCTFVSWWFSSLWITSLCSGQQSTNQHTWPWQMERAILPRGLCWSFQASHQQCDSCLQPCNLTGHFSIPCHLWFIFQYCATQHVHYWCRTKVRRDVGCTIPDIWVGSFWCLLRWHWTAQYSPLFWQQLRSHTRNDLSCLTMQMYTWLLTRWGATFWGSILQQQSWPLPHNVDLSVKRNGHSGTKAASTPAPVNEGTVSSDSMSEMDSHIQSGS